MKCCIEGKEVDISTLGVDAYKFGHDPNSVCTLRFSLEVDFDQAIRAFGEYYKDFIEREKEDEGVGEVLTGYYLKLSLTGYLDLDSMLLEQPTLLASVLRNYLPTEFMGYLFHVTAHQNMEKKYILQTLEGVAIGEGKIKCTGRAFIMPTLLTGTIP